MKTSQELNHKLKEDLLRSRSESNRIHRSKPHFQKLILYNSIVSSIPLLSSSKYMEKQIQAKTMLHQTKQSFFKETAQRNSVIQKLEKEVIKLGLDPTAIWLI